MRVLVVDIDPAVRDSLTSILTAGDHSVRGVATAKGAIDALDRSEFDVMFTDLWVGRHSGMSLLATSRDRWPRMSVIILTRRASTGAAVQALRLGALDYLQKPVTPAQVLTVLDLVEQQKALIEKGAPPLDPVKYSRDLARAGGFEVLLISPSPPPKPVKGVQHVPLDADNPYRIREAVLQFAASRKKLAVVMAEVEKLLKGHREEEVAALLESIRVAVEGKGPLVVGYAPRRISASGALAVRAATVSKDAHSTIEAISSPTRRLILRRLIQGRITFSQAVAAARSEDTSKVAFHVRKLKEAGLISLRDKHYRLTPRGAGAVRVLEDVDELEPRRGSGNQVFRIKDKAEVRREASRRPARARRANERPR